MGASSLRVSLSDRLKHAARRQAARIAGVEREMPSYFIIGTKRGGTTSLSHYIHQHPNVLRPLVEKGCRYFDVNYSRGWDWFVQNMPPAKDADRAERLTGVRPIVGESSPYYVFHPKAPERIAAAFPTARLILIIRDPVLRSWSHYNYERSLGFESLEIHDALDSEPHRLTASDPDARAFSHRHHTYLARGLYAEQIEHLYEEFTQEQLLVIQSEALFEDPETTMSQVHSHLELASYIGNYSAAKKANSYEEVPDDIRIRLAEYYAEPNARLFDLIGYHPTWC